MENEEYVEAFVDDVEDNHSVSVMASLFHGGRIDVDQFEGTGALYAVINRHEDGETITTSIRAFGLNQREMIATIKNIASAVSRAFDTPKQRLVLSMALMEAAGDVLSNNNNGED